MSEFTVKQIGRWLGSRQAWTLACVLLWLAALSAGFAALQSYMHTPGEGGPVSNSDPVLLSPEAVAPRARLMMFLHPHCPCSRASLEELHKAIALAKEPVTVEVLLVKPAGMESGWEQGVSANAAIGIPGVQVRCDDGGLLARHYGATTSGQVLFYDRDGKLKFSGGLTRLRGHAGESAGTRSIMALLTGQPAETSKTPVYGCPLFHASERHVVGATCGSPLGARERP